MSMKTNNIVINSIMEKSLKYICTVLFLLFIGTCAYAQSMIVEEQAAVKSSSWSTYSLPYTFSSDVISITTQSASGSAYSGGSGSNAYIKIAAGKTVTFTAPTGGNIVRMNFSPDATHGGMNYDGIANTGTWTKGSSNWTGSANSVTLTAPAGNTIAWKNVTVTVRYSAAGYSDVTISPTSVSWTASISENKEQTFTISGLNSFENYEELLMSEADYNNTSMWEDYSGYITVSNATFTKVSNSATSVRVRGSATATGTYTCYLCLHGTEGTSGGTDYRRLDMFIPITLTVTGCDNPAKPVITNPISPVSYTTATVSWGAAANATKYDLKIGTTSGGSQFATYSNLTGTSKEITGLTPGTTYYATVVAKNDCGVTTNTSTSVSFTTLTCPTLTGTPTVTISNITGNSVHITYSQTNAVSYTFRIEDNETAGSGSYSHQYTKKTTTTRDFSDLSSGTTYWVWVIAYNDCDEYVQTKTSFTTASYHNYVYTCLDINLEQTDGTSNPLLITSAAGQTIKAVRTLTLSVDGETSVGTKDVTLSGTDLLFYKSDGTQITGNVLQTSSGDLVATPIYVAYAPTAYESEALVNPVITVSCDGVNKRFEGLVTGRCLPDNFVIASKIGNFWYALPANCTSSSSNTSGIPIAVDNVSDPSSATGPANLLDYGLRNVASSRFAANGSNLVFTERLTTETADNQKTLYNGSTTSIQVSAMYSGYALTNPTKYEWVAATSDLKDYTLTSAVEDNRTVSLNTRGVWGTLTEDRAYSGQVRLLPLTEITDMQVEVMEWGTSSMALRFAGDVPDAVDITLGANSWTNKALTNITSGGTSDLYSVTGLDLTSDNCTLMTIRDHDNASKVSLIRKPILVNTTDATSGAYKMALTDDVCEGCDIVVLSTGKLTANQTKATHTSFANLYVYPGGKLVLDGQSLGVKNKVYVRGGYSWLNTSTYALPEIYLNGDINFNGSSNIIYDYYIHNYQYYQFALPYTVPLANVTDEAGVDNFPVWVKHYNGALRAANASATSWDWYNGDNFEAGVGYIIAARPRDVNGVRSRPLAIIRFPLGNSAYNGAGEEGGGNRTVSTTAHGISGYEAGTVTANNVGWNLVGNPYMATWQAPAAGIGHKQLTKDPDAEHWNGSYKWVDGATKYITIMSAESGSDYEQYPSANKQLSPFFPFFFQETAEGGSGTLTFAVANRQKKAPAYMSEGNEVREAFVQIDYTNGVSQDQTGVYVGNKYSDDLDFDDYEKMFGSQTTKPKVWIMHESTRLAFEAMSETRAAGSVPMGYRAPEKGEYTFTINEYSNLEFVESVLLDDNEAGVYNYNLLTSDYTFSSENVLFNDTRFVIRIVMKDENTGGTTGTENIDLRSEETQKFIYHDKMYILRNGVLYDATGKRVREINK